MVDRPIIVAKSRALGIMNVVAAILCGSRTDNSNDAKGAFFANIHTLIRAIPDEPAEPRYRDAPRCMAPRQALEERLDVASLSVTEIKGG